MMNMEDGKPQRLSIEQQRALFINETNLKLFTAAKGIVKSTRFGSLVSSEINPEVAEWALSKAQRIRNSEAKYREGRIREALSEFQNIHVDLPDAAIVLIDIGVCYAALGDKVLARTYLEKALTVIPTEYAQLAQENLRRLENR